ncbi:hypothetical protein BKH43_01310 [Helicobacter sp. 13S00401-1]|uniref:ABC transporter substrate-binding protein n=1 Tax=Helicobacter sp. 13S00401-1 TaxID=1905758 RepID=UPI000BA5667C|nr:ABC transporter substrate-binding protein [Helicobacter sp. 13S00401-1]PAF51897.1 hypothetical protein BKH43_01310 [Helicobacter sp. 13S00401-1]
MKIIFLLASLLGFIFASSSSYPVTITDIKGYKVTLDKRPEKIVIAGNMWPLPAMLIALTKNYKDLLFIPTASYNALQDSILEKFYPGIKNIKHTNSENIELLLSYKPDLFICHTANDKLCMLMKASKIPTIMLTTNPPPGKYDPLNSLTSWLNILGPVLDKKDLSEQLLQDAKQTQKFVKERLINTNPKRVLIIHRFSKNELAVGGLFANHWMEKASGINVYQNLKGIKNINLEDLYSKNIDVIFITNFNTLTPKELMANKDFAFIKAIKTKQVYKFPLFTYRSFATSADYSLTLYFLAKTLHPEVFKDVDLNAKIKEHFEKFYGLKVSDKDIDSMLSPSPKAGNTK